MGSGGSRLSGFAPSAGAGPGCALPLRVLVSGNFPLTCRPSGCGGGEPPNRAVDHLWTRGRSTLYYAGHCRGGGDRGLDVRRRAPRKEAKEGGRSGEQGQQRSVCSTYWGEGLFCALPRDSFCRYDSHFPDGRSEAQRVYVTCRRAHSS